MELFECLQSGSSFRDMKEKWPHFKEDSRNVRLSLLVDGVNLYAHKRAHNVDNNKIPPWLSIKREHIMLTMIILGMCLQEFFFSYSGISLVVF